jgi:sterol-4alpha-carboxylate 3-dehydrogenase (decarboxylating)
VNVEGTRTVVAAAQSLGIRKFVFTSSAGVVFNGADIIGVDERLPLPEEPLDAYNESKAKAEEVVLAANGQKGLLTVALRPAGIFGYATIPFNTGRVH